MRKLTLATAIILLLPAMSLAGKFSGDPFSLGVGGRGLALGGAMVAGPFDGTAPYWNPAGMNYLDGRYLTAMHAETFGSLLNHDFVSYVDRRGDESSVIKAFGFYVYYLGGGGIKFTELNQFNRPFVVKEASHGDWLFSAALSGRAANGIDFGLTAKAIVRDIGDETGLGLTVDAGALYQVHRYARLGLMVTDITTGFIRYSGGSPLRDSTGATFSSETNTESIYPTVKPGLMLEYRVNTVTGRFLASGDIKFEGLKTTAQFWSGDLSLDTHWGLELGYRERLFGRAGFDIGRFTAGGGVNVRQFTIDFAYLQHDELDETYRVSAGFHF